MKEAVKQSSVFEKEIPEVNIDSENTVTMLNVNQFEGHIGSAFHGVFVTAGGAETTVAAKGDKFKFSTVGAAIHGAPKGGIATVDHFINVFHLRISGMKGIFNRKEGLIPRSLLRKQTFFGT